MISLFVLIHKLNTIHRLIRVIQDQESYELLWHIQSPDLIIYQISPRALRVKKSKQYQYFEIPIP